jgi:hypothetical protein
MRNLFNPETFQSSVDDLYNGTLIPRKFRPVTVAGTGVIKRGTPLTGSGSVFVQLTPGQGPGTIDADDEVLIYNYGIVGILLFDVDTNDEEEAGNAVMGISGEFNQNKIEEALGAELDPEDIMRAWGRNIHIEKNNTYPATPDFPLG